MVILEKVARVERDSVPEPVVWNLARLVAAEVGQRRAVLVDPTVLDGEVRFAVRLYARTAEELQVRAPAHEEAVEEVRRGMRTALGLHAYLVAILAGYGLLPEEAL